MNRQDFGTWKAERLKKSIPANKINAWVDGADAAYNLLSKEISEKDYWKQRCEAAEALVTDFDPIWFDKKEGSKYSKWQKTINYDKE